MRLYGIVPIFQKLSCGYKGIGSKISVYGVSSIQHPSQLSSARLGLPVKSSKCESCGTDKLDECEGHFGHIRLPTPIYHPSHVAEVKRILSRICLNCFELKKKTKVRSLVPKWS
eukprot:Gb_21422 [translate_table: standard]